MTEVSFSLWFIDESGFKVEYCASSNTYEEIKHYEMVYSQDGPVGIFMDVSVRMEEESSSD